MDAQPAGHGEVVQGRSFQPVDEVASAAALAEQSGAKTTTLEKRVCQLEQASLVERVISPSLDLARSYYRLAADD